MYGKKYSYNGKTMYLSEWSQETGIPIWTLRARIVKYGWSLKRAFTTKPERRMAEVHMRNKVYSYSALARKSPCGISAGTIRDRIVNQHMAPEDAISITSAKDGHTLNAIKRKPEFCMYPACDKCQYDDCIAN